MYYREKMGKVHIKQSLFALMAACLVFASAEAAPLCATPGELKLLKAAMLEQALTAAAQSCHQSAEFGRFVAAYHSGMVASDRALQAFFGRRTSGESYHAYKARMAAEIAARSLHDARFCAEAGRVFDIALKQKQAPVPRLIATGYEHCGAPRAPASKPVEVVAALRPVKPVPATAPIPVLSPIARKALALAPRRQAPPQPEPLPPLKVVAQAAPVKAVKAAPIRQQAEFVRAEPPSEDAADDRPPRDLVPNAYKPGAYWVDHETQTDGPPPPRAHHSLVLGPDGRWYVLTGHHNHWSDD